MVKAQGTALCVSGRVYLAETEQEQAKPEQMDMCNQMAWLGVRGH